MHDNELKHDKILLVGINYDEKTKEHSCKIEAWEKQENIGLLVLPIEIKAGRKKANTLNNVLKSDAIKQGYKLSLQNAGRVGKKLTMPIYMLMFL